MYFRQSGYLTIIPCITNKHLQTVCLVTGLSVVNLLSAITYYVVNLFIAHITLLLLVLSVKF